MIYYHLWFLGNFGYLPPSFFEIPDDEEDDDDDIDIDTTGETEEIPIAG